MRATYSLPLCLPPSPQVVALPQEEGTFEGPQAVWNELSQYKHKCLELEIEL